MKKHTKQLSKTQRQKRSQRKKWTALERFANVQNNLVRNAIANNKKPPKRITKNKLNPTQLFEKRQRDMKRIRPEVLEELVAVETQPEELDVHIHSEDCTHEHTH